MILINRKVFAPITRPWPGGLGLLALVLLLAAGSPVKQTEPLGLKPAVLPFVPQEFYLSQVIDARVNRQAVALLVVAALPGKPGAAAATHQVDLKGGGTFAFREFFRQSLPVNKSLRPVVVRVLECRMAETLLPDKRIEGKVNVALAFDIQRNGKTVHTLPYKGGARYQRLPSQTTLLEPVLRQSLADGLTYLNTWMNREAATHEKLATGLRITFRDFADNNDPDTLFYGGRPLKWSDFRAQPRPGPYAAAVFPSFSYEGRSRVENGLIHLNLILKVFVVREASWTKVGNGMEGLLHEQRHFDIVKLVAERFKKQVRAGNLSVEDYNSEIQYQFLESWREMTALQNKYDAETRHGLDGAAQAQWNQKITEELKAYLPGK